MRRWSQRLVIPQTNALSQPQIMKIKNDRERKTWSIFGFLVIDNMHFTHSIYYSLMILKHNARHYCACYRVLSKYSHLSYHIVYKLNSREIAFVISYLYLSLTFDLF